jgi:hypothetical protein
MGRILLRICSRLLIQLWCGPIHLQLRLLTIFACTAAILVAMRSLSRGPTACSRWGCALSVVSTSCSRFQVAWINRSSSDDAYRKHFSGRYCDEQLLLSRYPQARLFRVADSFSMRVFRRFRFCMQKSTQKIFLLTESCNSNYSHRRYPNQSVRRKS